MTHSPFSSTTSASTPRSSVFAPVWVLAFAALTMAACAGDRPDRDLSFELGGEPVSAEAAPRPRPPVTPPPPDTRGIELAVVGGSDPVPPPVEIEGGEATLSGSLAFGGEPVVGATVRLERWVDGRMNWIELQTSEGGGWMAEDIFGGRYVIRAWKGDRLALPQASALFLAEDEERQVHLAMAQLRPPPSTADDENDDGEADEDPDGDADNDADDDAEADEANEEAGSDVAGTSGTRGDGDVSGDAGSTDSPDTTGGSGSGETGGEPSAATRSGARVGSP